MTLKAQPITEKKNQYIGLIQINNFCSAKDIVKGLESQGAELLKIFANYIFDKGFISRKYKELFKPNSKKIKKSS